MIIEIIRLQLRGVLSACQEAEIPVWAQHCTAGYLFRPYFPACRLHHCNIIIHPLLIISNQSNIRLGHQRPQLNHVEDQFVGRISALLRLTNCGRQSQRRCWVRLTIIASRPGARMETGKAAVSTEECCATGGRHRELLEINGTISPCGMQCSAGEINNQQFYKFTPPPARPAVASHQYGKPHNRFQNIHRKCTVAWRASRAS